MTTIKRNKYNTFYRNACIAMIFCAIFYSSIIQHYYSIRNGMLLLGGSALIFYALANRGTIVLREIITEENEIMLYYLAYMLLIGILFSPNRNSHISQWITCIEYLVFQILITSMIKEFGANAFHVCLLFVAFILDALFLINPVDYRGRLSISLSMNPNGLGMELSAGIWAALYLQQKRKLPLILIGVIVALLGYGILLTGSRKSLIAAGAMIILWMVFCFLPSLKGKGPLIGLVSLLFFSMLVFFIGKEFTQLYSETGMSERIEDLAYETSEGNRSQMYRAGFELLKTNPLFGIGFQGFAYYFGSYSHATLVEIPVSGGIIGAILYFSAYVVSIRKLFFLYRKTKQIPGLIDENIRVKMVLILWAAMLFYTVCIIHPYQFDSAIMFGIIFGETAYIESRLNVKQEVQEGTKIQRIGSKYIKNA